VPGKEKKVYLGMVPKQIQSGEMNRLGKITRQGNRLLRSLLVEVEWVGLRYNSWMRTNQAREEGAKEDSDRGRWAKIADSLLGDAARRHTVARGSKDRLTK